MYQNDTIAAVATPAGESSVGIVRISGQDTLTVISKIFKPNRKVKQWSSYKLYYGHIHDPKSGAVIDEVLVGIMLSPKSYTREDVAEINCHGGYIALSRCLETVLSCGIRMAEPGEFTKRAYLNGRIDLSQAEAVADIIRSRTDRSMELAVRQLDGHLSTEINRIYRPLMEVIAQIEAVIDFPEDDVEEITRHEIAEKLSIALGIADQLLKTAERGQIIKEGLRTVILGKPNVGKSSLMNALLKENRAIVTEIPGTTRDVIEESINLAGIPLRIVDTAGIRDTEDIVEKIGVEKAMEYSRKADLVLLVLDDSDGISHDDRTLMDLLYNQKTLVLINKTDLSENRILDTDIPAHLHTYGIIRISVKESSGIELIEKAILEMVYGGQLDLSESTMITNIRHAVLVKAAYQSIEAAIVALQAATPVDLVVIDIWDAATRLGEIVGTQVSEEMLEEIFSRFCLGK